MEVIHKRSEVTLPSFIGHLRSFVLHPRAPRSSFSFLSEYLAITYRDVNANNYSLSLRASRDNIVIYKTAFQEERSCLSLADLTRLESPRLNLKTLMDARIPTRWRSNYSVISYKCAVSVFLTRSRWINIALNQFMCSWPNINWSIHSLRLTFQFANIDGGKRGIHTGSEVIIYKVSQIFLCKWQEWKWNVMQQKMYENTLLIFVFVT